jgi:hypothetical protein
VPDDHAAMRDIARVLAPSGIGLVAVPLRPGPTDEDPSVGVEERIRRFGQADHVRYYGDDDFESRLTAAGLAVSTFRADDLVDPWLVDLLKLIPNERFCLVRPLTSPDKLPGVEELSDRVGRELAGCLSTASAAAVGPETLAGARAEAVAWKTRYDQLRGRPHIKAMLQAGRAYRRLRSRLR